MSKNPFLSVFGGIIAICLFIIYVCVLIYMISEVLKSPAGSTVEFGDGLTYVVTTIGGLVSALVIAKLALTEPGHNPAEMRILKDSSKMANGITSALVYVYLFGWVFSGIGALIVGVILYPEANNTLSDIGTNWLGLAVAAGYSFFGIRPPENNA